MMSNQPAKLLLPGGFWIDGVRHQEVELRALTGNDQDYFLEAKKSLFQAEWTTALLARCIKRLGPLNPVTSDNVRSLTVGDREALLLHARRLTLGNQLDCVVNCPNDDCGEKMGLNLAISNFLLTPYENAQDLYETTISENDKSYQVKFRLPTGSDQEEAARTAKSNPHGAAEQVLRSCIMNINTDSKDEVEALPLSVKENLPYIIAELDPQAELTLNISCTGCRTQFSTILDAGSYFSRELKSNLNHLYNEVHLIAYHYHWSEKEIMSMTTSKRHRYRDLLLNVLSDERDQ